MSILKEKSCPIRQDEIINPIQQAEVNLGITGLSVIAKYWSSLDALQKKYMNDNDENN